MARVGFVVEKGPAAPLATGTSVSGEGFCVAFPDCATANGKTIKTIAGTIRIRMVSPLGLLSVKDSLLATFPSSTEFFLCSNFSHTLFGFILVLLFQRVSIPLCLVFFALFEFFGRVAIRRTYNHDK